MFFVSIRRRRCADNRAPLRLLLTLSVFCCCLTTAVQAHAQFTNLRIFRAGDLLNKDYWRPVKSSKNSDDIDPAHLSTSNSRKSETGDSSPIKRVSMASLLQQLNLSSNQMGKKDDVIPTIVAAHEELNLSVPVAINSAAATSKKESPIRRIKLPAGSIYYSRNFNNSMTGPVIQVNINPHLSSSTTTTTTIAPSTTEELTTTTTEEPPTTTTTAASTTSETPTAKSYVKASKQQPAKVYPIGKAKTPGASLRASNFGSGKKLSEMQNSPIYYIKLPASAFVSSARTPYSDDSLPYFKQSPIFVATTKRPGADGSTTTATSTEAPFSDSLSTTTRRPTRTNSRIINIKGPFVFNGKPGGIYSAPAPYRPPNYLDILHSIYPKLKRAQFIRRR